MKKILFTLALLLCTQLSGYCAVYPMYVPMASSSRKVTAHKRASKNVLYIPKGYTTYQWARDSNNVKHHILCASDRNTKVYNVSYIITIVRSVHSGLYTIDIDTGSSLDYIYYRNALDRTKDFYTILQLMNK